MKNKKGWKRWKQITVAALALLLVSGSADLSVFAVHAEIGGDDTAVKKQTHVTAFERLDREIVEQQLPVGASEDDIIFPETLKVTVKQRVASGEAADEPEAETKADTDMDTDKADVQDNDAIDADAAEADTDAAAEVQRNDAETGTDEDEADAQDDKDETETDRESDEKDADADTNDIGDAEDTDADDIGDTADVDADTDDTEDEEAADTDTDDMEAVDEEAAFLEELFSVFTPLQVQAAGSEKKQLTLTDITWEIDPEESDGDTFDSSADSNGKCYVYVPILPDTDADGNELCLDEDAELPMIYVLIGERGIMPLENTASLKTVSVKTGSEVLPNGTLTYGEPLSKLSFQSVTFVDDGDNEVSGTLNWAAPDTKPDANTNTDGTEITGKPTAFSWTFTPDDTTTYQTITDMTKVTVYPAKPTVAQSPVISLPSISYTTHEWTVTEIFDPAAYLGSITGVDGAELKDIKWKWWYEDAAGDTDRETRTFNVGSHTQAVIGIVQIAGGQPDTNYQKIRFSVTLNVTKCTPTVTSCTISGAYTHGDFLRDQTLSGTVKDEKGEELPTLIPTYTFVWKEPDTQLSHTDNGKSYTYIMIPVNTQMYNSVEGTVKVTVNKLPYPPNQPATSMNVSQSCDTVSKVSLPTDWAWSESDKTKTLDENGSAVSATAEYTGADKDSYQNISVPVSITRSNCEHVESDVIVDTDPTCTTAGIGHTVCSKNECKQTVRDNITIPAKGHDYQRRNPDPDPFKFESSAFYYYRCSVCKTEYKTAAPVSSGSENPGSENSGSGDLGGSNSGSKSSGSSHRSRKSSGSSTSGASGIMKNMTPVSQSLADSDIAGVPFIAGQAQGWDAIRTHLQDAADGSVLTVHMNGAAIVPSDILQMIRGKAVILVFDMGDGTAWMVNGLFMLAAAEGAPIAVYYADYLQGTLTLADVAVLTTDGILAHIYTCAQQCFAITSF